MSHLLYSPLAFLLVIRTGRLGQRFSLGRNQTASFQPDTTFWKRANDDLDPKVAPGLQKLSAFIRYRQWRALSRVYQTASGSQVLDPLDQIFGYLMTPGVQQNRFLATNGRDNAPEERSKHWSLKTYLRP
ncbi:hypothetical protein CEXT_289721 [Caerostris extrusa]|uniref:Uncharacterized protein n=1 Tax=Caerostris extrusa TaxID=172846 RepID=A0AAV4VNJ5_CAEEX|nr:hypothetical protein CEXT_289721 [Caerostris extrusa]